ncbi:MAG TPA: cupredoxin domain-containing protein [Acidimicrobiales bacterium]|nr:cupredoxin domain-containing protein [Acidimicrobiales bacterium]
MRVRKTVLAGMMVLMLPGVVACGGGGDDELTADVKVEDDQLRYSPDELEIDLNREETFTFLNNDDVVHNVTIPALSHDDQFNAIDIDIPAGERVAVRVPAVAEAPRDGFFLFYCKYHQTEGMSGRLKISS